MQFELNYKKEDLKSRFIAWYYSVFVPSALFRRMDSMGENSPWHREQTIGIHTNMVVAQYMSSIDGDDEWTGMELAGALASAFHDVGKPFAAREKFKPERGNYLSFGGHEIISARMWETYAVQNWSELKEIFGEAMTPSVLYFTTFIIEHHLPWGLKNERKLNALAMTAVLNHAHVFEQMLWADTLGRFSDDGVEKREKVEAWIDAFYRRRMALCSSRYVDDTAPKMYVVVGASGTGKSTFCSTLESARTYSLDALRLEFYTHGKTIPSAEDEYDMAFQMSCDDKTFRSRANTRYVEMLREGGDLIVDNVNTSFKRRRWYIDEAQKRGYVVVGVYIPADLNVIKNRQETRGDKNVPLEAVERQYNTLQLPLYGEFDEILIIPSNLK